MTGLPAWISAALANKLEHVSRADLRARAKSTSDAYRAGNGSDLIRDELDALAYAVVRMPATYAAVRAALRYAIEIVPDFAPRSMLDVGAGPGTASWAAVDAWPSLRTATLIDSNPRLMALARGLRDAMPVDVTAGFIAGGAASALVTAPGADVVMASYVLAELAPQAASDGLDALWRHADRLLVIVEPGTVDGFKRILACREALIAKGATIIAPCSHEGPCPLADAARWCHFAARLARSRDHLVVKDAQVPFEDEKFSYLIAGKGSADVARGARVLATPRVSKAGVALTLCAPGAAEERSVPHRDKQAYKAAKRLDWGDAINA